MAAITKDLHELCRDATEPHVHAFLLSQHGSLLAHCSQDKTKAECFTVEQRIAFYPIHAKLQTDGPGDFGTKEKEHSNFRVVVAIICWFIRFASGKHSGQQHQRPISHR